MKEKNDKFEKESFKSFMILACQKSNTRVKPKFDSV